jgi:hypothetical protein
MTDLPAMPEQTGNAAEVRSLETLRTWLETGLTRGHPPRAQDRQEVRDLLGKISRRLRDILRPPK